MVVIVVPQLKKRHSKINKRGRYARASIPSEAMMHLPPVSDFPPIFDKFSDSVENVQNFTFSRQISRFSSAKISDDLFLVIDQNFEFPLFFLFQHISPCFAKIIISPTFKNFPPVLEKFTCFLHTLCVSFSPLLWPWCIYASPNARTGRPWRYAL